MNYGLKISFQNFLSYLMSFGICEDKFEKLDVYERRLLKNRFLEQSLDFCEGASLEEKIRDYFENRHSGPGFLFIRKLIILDNNVDNFGLVEKHGYTMICDSNEELYPEGSVVSTNGEIIYLKIKPTDVNNLSSIDAYLEARSLLVTKREYTRVNSR